MTHKFGGSKIKFRSKMQNLCSRSEGARYNLSLNMKTISQTEEARDKTSRIASTEVVTMSGCAFEKSSSLKNEKLKMFVNFNVEIKFTVVFDSSHLGMDQVKRLWEYIEFRSRLTTYPGSPLYFLDLNLSDNIAQAGYKLYWNVILVHI